MKYAWKKIKEEEFTHFYIDLTPNGFKRKFYAWADKSNGPIMLTPKLLDGVLK